MTAFDLIDSIFARVQLGTPGHQRRITQQQYDYLRGLIEEDPEGSAFRAHGPGEMIWMPSGRTKYILSEEGPGRKRMLTKMGSLQASAMGRLF